MNSWKEKATDKISHLFSRSPARSYPEDSKSSSSIFSYILPSSSFDRSKSKNDTSDIRPIQSPPVKWKSRSVLWQDIPSDIYDECDHHAHEKKQDPNFLREDQGHDFRKRNVLENEDLSSGSSSSDLSEDVADHHNKKSTSYMTEESSLISSDLYDFLLSCLPNIVKGCQWELLYSTGKHGISLRTLIRRSADIPGLSILIVGDKQGAVFGGMLECPLQPTPKRKYQGTNKAFVFTTRYGEPRLFRPTGANRYYCMCLNELLGLGGGGNMALCLDGDLLVGTSGPCETFGNSCLAHTQEFEIKNVELWGFAHSSRYLN